MSVDLHLRPVVQMLDSTIEIYPEDSVMHLLNNWGPYLSRSINTCLGYRATEPLQDFVLYSAVAPSIISIRRIVGVFRRSQPNVFLFRICLLAPHTCGDLTRTTTSTARLHWIAVVSPDDTKSTQNTDFFLECLDEESWQWCGNRKFGIRTLDYVGLDNFFSLLSSIGTIWQRGVVVWVRLATHLKIKCQ